MLEKGDPGCGDRLTECSDRSVGAPDVDGLTLAAEVGIPARSIGGACGSIEDARPCLVEAHPLVIHIAEQHGLVVQHRINTRS